MSNRLEFEKKIKIQKHAGNVRKPPCQKFELTNEVQTLNKQFSLILCKQCTVVCVTNDFQLTVTQDMNMKPFW